jgi:hypothetical protein
MGHCLVQILQPIKGMKSKNEKQISRIKTSLKIDSGGSGTFFALTSALSREIYTGIVEQCSTHATRILLFALVELEAAPASSEGWASSIKNKYHSSCSVTVNVTFKKL